MKTYKMKFNMTR